MVGQVVSWTETIMLIDPDFFDHWRTRMLADLLGDECAPIYIMRLWAHCQLRKSDRFDLPASALKAVCRYPGDADEFERAMIDGGWVEREGETIIATGWADKNAKLVQAWENGAKGGRPKTQRKPKHNPRVTQQEPTDNPTVTHGKPIGLDKRREDKGDAAHLPPKPPKGGVSPPSKQHPYTPDFDAWWKTYPCRDGCPPGNKRATFVEWLRLGADRDNTARQLIYRATRALSAATTAGETKPKDAERFLRPPRGGGDPPYLGWLDAKAPTGIARGSPKTYAQRSDSYNHTEDRSWLTGETA